MTAVSAMLFHINTPFWVLIVEIGVTDLFYLSLHEIVVKPIMIYDDQEILVLTNTRFLSLTNTSIY